MSSNRTCQQGKIHSKKSGLSCKCMIKNLSQGKARTGGEERKGSPNGSTGNMYINEKEQRRRRRRRRRGGARAAEEDSILNLPIFGSSDPESARGRTQPLSGPGPPPGPGSPAGGAARCSQRPPAGHSLSRGLLRGGRMALWVGRMVA
eukprot:754299-Hanusia_phi.AAC.3